MTDRKPLRYMIVSLVVAAAGVTSTVAPAFADLSGRAVYEVEAKEQYCADGTTQCVPARGAPRLGDLRFSLVELYRLSSSPGGQESSQHNSTAAPEVLLAKCAGPHSIDKRGNIHSSPVMTVIIGPTDQGLNPGTISGSVSVHNGQESDAAATAAVAVEGHDMVTGDSAVVTGQQVTNNASDSLVSGGFTVTLTGPQFDEIVAGPDANESAPPTPTGKTGTMTCTTGNPSVSTPGAPPAYWENEILDAVDPSS